MTFTLIKKTDDVELGEKSWYSTDKLKGDAEARVQLTNDGSPQFMTASTLQSRSIGPDAAEGILCH